MMNFNSDYISGAHPKVLEKLVVTNAEETTSYGNDVYCAEARRLISQYLKNENAEIHFLSGGTQTNLAIICAALRPHQGVMAAETGHIATHETGAVEACGHKVLTIRSSDGKLRASQILEAVCLQENDENHEHTVQPKMVYISNPTELGTIYSKKELFDISQVCREKGIYLYMDGARLGYALCAKGNDVELRDLAALCDAFVIGGTKNGALFGEALVICNDDLKKDFRYILKQKGGMLAKGRVLGVQFIALFEHGLYFEIAKQANELAMVIKDACVKKGYGFLTDSPTNQQFPIIPNSLREKLNEKYKFSFWQNTDLNHCAVRFCTGWSTQRGSVAELVEDIMKF